MVSQIENKADISCRFCKVRFDALTQLGENRRLLK